MKTASSNCRPIPHATVLTFTARRFDEHEATIRMKQTMPHSACARGSTWPCRKYARTASAKAVPAHAKRSERSLDMTCECAQAATSSTSGDRGGGVAARVKED